MQNQKYIFKAIIYHIYLSHDAESWTFATNELIFEFKLFINIFQFHSLADDDSDVDEVTDYLNSNTNVQDGNRTEPGSDVVDTKSSSDSNVNKSTKSNASPASARSTHQLPTQNNQQPNHQSHNHHINNNMVPIISVTPHSPGAKFNNILGKFGEN